MEDNNIKNNIKNLILLKGKCIACRKNLDEILHKKGIYHTSYSASFFTTMETLLDSYIVNFLNETTCNARNDREPINNIIEKIMEDIRKKDIEFEDFKCNSDLYSQHGIEEDFRHLFSERINEWLSSQILSFGIDSYSQFEYWSVRLYDSTFNSTSRGKEKKISEILNKHIGIDANDEKALSASREIISKVINFTSSSEKIDRILSKTGLSKDISKTRIIKLLRTIRNSIHNLGLYFGKDDVFETYNGRKLYLTNGKAVKLDDYNDHFYLVSDLMDIYIEIIKKLEFSEPSLVLESIDLSK